MRLSTLRRDSGAFMDRIFVPREIFVRSGNRFHHIKVTIRAQKLAAAASTVLVAWLLFASGSIVVQNAVIAIKERDIERQRLGYFDLLADASDYQTHLLRITRELGENQKYLLSLVEQEPTDREALKAAQERLEAPEFAQARTMVARADLRAKIRQFERDLQSIAERNQSLRGKFNQMQALLNDSEEARQADAVARERVLDQLIKRERELAAAEESRQELGTMIAELRGDLVATRAEKAELGRARERLSANVAALERRLRQADAEQGALRSRIVELDGRLAQEIARSGEMQNERGLLEQRVAGLEDRLVQLHDAGQGVMERLTKQARLSIEVVERTVAMTGLDVDGLIVARSSDELGKGGPFVPADEVTDQFGPSLQLEASVSLLDEQLDRWAALQQVVGALPLIAPLDQYRISSSFGERKDPVNGRKAQHQGIDFAVPLHTPVHATAPGKVIFAGWRGLYGRVIEIDHGHGIRTRYGHLRKILVEVGQQVEHREKIALVGSSGRSTGPHLHYEIRYKGVAQNPSNFLEAGRYVYKG